MHSMSTDDGEKHVEIKLPEFEWWSDKTDAVGASEQRKQTTRT